MGLHQKLYIYVTYTEVPIRCISISGAQWVYEGNTTQLTATVSPDNATGDKTIKWDSDDESIAKVDSNGKVTAKSEGTVTITAKTTNGKTATCKVTVSNNIPSVKYSTHVQKEGWQNFVENGALSGTTGKEYRLEAIKIELTGEIAKQYDIYYRVHAQKFGWMGWAKNGEQSGTQGYGYRVEAMQIQLLPKGSKPSGSTANAFKQK